MSSLHLGLIFLAVILVGATIFNRKKRSQAVPLPPGPQGVPLLGNLPWFLCNSNFIWLKFTELAQFHGELIYLNLAGKSVVVLNSAEAAFDLLDQRGSNYSNRPELIMASKILAGGVHIGFVPYGILWRKLRKAVHFGLNKKSAEAYFTIQEQETKVLVRRLLKAPDEWHGHFNLLAASTILSIVYGVPYSLSLDEPHIRKIYQFMEHMLHAAVPGNYLVDIFPFLNRLPPWLARFKQEGLKAHQTYTDLFVSLLESETNKSYRNLSFAASLSKNEKDLGLTIKEKAWLAGSLFGGGSDTTASVLSVFMLAMILHPHVLKKAQAEIDQVVGKARMPCFQDQGNLPYIGAIMKEALRWIPITPLGLARSSNDPLIYKGHYIPGNSIILTNVWAMNRNPDVYHNPTEFIPERYLSSDNKREIRPKYTREGTHAFGFGRRVCPGSNIANNTLFITIATMVWGFDITLSDPSHPPSMDSLMDNGAVLRPCPFKCSLSPRPHTESTVSKLVDE
ncbi:cytochrome P450 [Gymnopus androsaceus JB14]|uniref:Cytochrome P450 n=1 Tax=Gymnopus androsaceus JB14 TaxID=1447944 RepID=A0A6A4HKY6_9AGAR|nr:cytochrome P450 [Gymnopus androsaceus JB14]